MGIGIPVPYSWAGSGINYPPSASPWSSTAIEAAPAYVFLTPGLANAPTAQEFNYVWDKLAKAARDGIGAAGSVLAQNWQASYTVPTIVSAAGFAWNPQLGLWVTCSGNSGIGANTFYTVTGYDQASPVALSSTFGLGPSAGAAMANGAIACDAAGATYVGAIVSGVVYLGTCVAGTGVGGGGAVGAGVTSISISAAANFAIVGYASSTGHAGVMWMNPNSGGTTIASFESNLSATTFVTGSNGTYGLAVGQNGHAYKMTSSGTVGTTSVTDTNISATIGTDIPVGLAWGTFPGAINGAWLLQCLPSGGGSIRRYYSSTDGVSWGAGGSTSSTAAAGTGLVAVGSLWASPVPTPPTTTILPQIIYAPDASIWHAVPQSGTGAVSTTGFALSASDHQMCFMNFQSGAQTARFSSFGGFGAVLT
jgi:hypothetical protein